MELVPGFFIGIFGGFFLQSITLWALNALRVDLFWGQALLISAVDIFLVVGIIALLKSANGRGVEGIINVLWALIIGAGINLGFFLPFISWAMQSVRIIVN